MTKRKTKIKFWKYQSEGNDFVIVDATKLNDLKGQRQIATLCNRVRGVGANGLILAKKTKPGWVWDFFNEDGSRADMCGNGAKCFASWLQNHGDPRKKKWTWKSRLGEVQADAGSGGLMWVKWPIADNAPRCDVIHELGLLVEGLNERGLAYIAAINTGIPHLVLVNHESWTQTDRSALNHELRTHSAFGSAGTNVTWHSLATNESVTFERGVEAETLACGTGAIAIYKALSDMNSAPTKASFDFPGGTLFVKKDSSGALWLGGKPVEVFYGEY